jgi:DNA-binding MarR family transcriptional regulator
MQMKALQSLYTQSPKLNQLNILREVAANAKVTQAELAKLCMLSVAMVNNYMKELCGSGLLEYHRRSIKTVTYHLTPSGKEHLKILQAELISEMVGMFVAAKEQIRDRIADQAKTELRRVVLHGSGNLAQLAFHALELADTDIVGICSDNPEAIGKEFCGREVLNSSQIRYLAPDAVIVADSLRAEEICQNLEFLLDRGIELIRLDGFSELNSIAHLKPDSSVTTVADLLNT